MKFVDFFAKTLGILFAIFVFIISLSLFFGLLSSFDKTEKFKFTNGEKNSTNIIAVYHLNGVIINNDTIIQGYNSENYIIPKKVKDDLKSIISKNLKVLIVRIDSPGGTVSASENLRRIFSNFKSENDVKLFFFVNDILTSGGYWAATSADKIFANYGSIIGSIGVSGPKWFYYDTPVSISSGFFGQNIETKNGIDVYSNQAGKSKDLFNPFRKPTINELKHLQLMVDDIYDDFVLKVSKNRSIDISFIKKNIGSLVFNSQQAKDNFLIDNEIDFDEMILKLAKENKFIDYKIIEKKKQISLIGNLMNIFYFNSTHNLCSYLNNNLMSISRNFLNEC